MNASAKKKAATGKRQIILTLNERAYALLVGVAAHDDYSTDELDKMVLRSAAGLVESTYGGLSEKEALEIFGVEE